MSAADKAARPVTAQELEAAALQVAQAHSTVTLLGQAADAAPDLQNALGLLGDYLYQCADELSQLHRRQQNHEEAQP